MYEYFSTMLIMYAGCELIHLYEKLIGRSIYK